MSTTTKANAELERPLEAHELDVVSGGGISVQQGAAPSGWYAPWASGGGAFKIDAAQYTGLAWDWYSVNVLGGTSTHLSLPAG